MSTPSTPPTNINLHEIYERTTTNATKEGKHVKHSHPTRTQFLKSTFHCEPILDQHVRENMRLRLKYFCQHVRWICRNIVNLEAIESRRDLVTFGVKYVKQLKTYATNLLKSVESKSYDKILKQTMPDILKLLHALESVVAREYVAPILSVNYLKHIQGMGMSLLTPHWSMMNEGSEESEHKLRIQELSQHIIPIYFNLMTLLHLLDLDLHNSLFYQCTSLLQKYHMVASGRSFYQQDEKDKEKSFYDQHVPYLNETQSLFELIHEMIHESASSLSIPSSIASLWLQEVRLALNMFELYKEYL